MSDQVPLTWSEVTIGSIARVVGGGTPPSKDPTNFAPPGQGIPWITPADLSGYRARTISRGARDLTSAGLAACGATLLPMGTVLFSSRAPIGYVAIAANEISTNQGFKSFVFPEEFDARFAYYQLKHLKPNAEAIATGTTFKEVSGAVASTLPFKVAPGPEQVRIADQLDALFAHAQACNDRLRSIPGLIKRLRAAVMNAAVSGDLSEPATLTKHSPASRTPFPIVPIINALAEPLRNGKSVRDGDGLRVLRLTALRTQNVDLNEVKSGDWSGIADIGRFLIRDGDFLVSRGNGSRDLVGRGGLVVGCSQSLAFPDTMIRLRVSPDHLLPEYLSVAWESEGVREQIAKAAKTTAGIWKVSQTDLERISIPLPTLDEQRGIVRRTKALLDVAAAVEKRYVAANLHAERLTSLLLAKAFRGELVNQEPNDEPAADLLARISMRRSQPPSPTKSRTPRPQRASLETHAMTKSRHDNDVMGQPYLARQLRRLGVPSSAEALFKVAELPVADFYKQLAWEVTQGHVKDRQTLLEPGDAA